jgi:hypothetical protein
MTRLSATPAKARFQSKPVSSKEKTVTPINTGCHQLELITMAMAAITNPTATTAYIAPKMPMPTGPISQRFPSNVVL